MLCRLIKIRNTRLYVLFSLILAMSFALSGVNITYAAVLPYMPETNQMISAGAAYELPRLIGLKFTSDSPFEFTFMLSKGDMPLTRESLQREVDNIGKYFLAALTLPEEDLWVNLSPYEQNRISTDELARTDLGKDMLGEDYVLKQLVSSVTYPESESGRKFWDDIYQKIQKKLGTTNIPVSTFNKVWIMPDKIRVLEADDRAAIDYAKLKVMMEGDYVALNNSKLQITDSKSSNKESEAISAQTMRDVIIPIIEQEVNTGKHFAHLRQIYSAIVMAVWFKKKLAKTILAQVYFDQKKIKGADVDDPQIRQKIYNEYTKAFRDGIYNYIRRDKVPGNNFKTIKRQYVSGGVAFNRTRPDFIPSSPGVVDRRLERDGLGALEDMIAQTQAGDAPVELVGNAGQGSLHVDIAAVMASAGDTFSPKIFDQLVEAGLVKPIVEIPGQYAFVANPQAKVSRRAIQDGSYAMGPKARVYTVAVGYFRRQAEIARANTPEAKAAAASAERARLAQAEFLQRQAEARSRQVRADNAERNQREAAMAQHIAQLMRARLETVAGRLATAKLVKEERVAGKVSYRVDFNLGANLEQRRWSDPYDTLVDAARGLLVGAARDPNVQAILYARLGILKVHPGSGSLKTVYEVISSEGLSESFFDRSLAISRINERFMVNTIVADEFNFNQIRSYNPLGDRMQWGPNGSVVAFGGHIRADGKVSELANWVSANDEPEFYITVDHSMRGSGQEYSMKLDRRGRNPNVIPLLMALARLNGLSNRPGMAGGIARREERSAGDVSGSMTEMGEPDQRINADREQKRGEWRTAMEQRWRSGDRGTAHQLQPRDGPAITYVLANDMPDWLPADHFEVEGEMVYVVNGKTLPDVNPNPAKNQRRDAIIADRAFHEAQEHFWRQQGYSERDAHILAWYDQLSETGAALTPQQAYELEQRKGEPGLYEKFAQSDRTYHRDLIERVHGSIGIEQHTGQDYLEHNREAILRKITSLTGSQGGGQKGTDKNGGLDFAGTNKMEAAVTGNGVQLSGDKAMAYLMSGKVAGFRLATTKLTF